MTLVHPRVDPPDVARPDAEALIREARSLRRRRWTIGIVVVAVAIFYLFGKLATEEHTIPDYLNQIRSGSSHERWQAAYQLSKSLKEVADNSEISNQDATRIYRRIFTKYLMLPYIHNI